jgi:hypothetical protein
MAVPKILQRALHIHPAIGLSLAAAAALALGGLPGLVHAPSPTNAHVAEAGSTCARRFALNVTLSTAASHALTIHVWYDKGELAAGATVS